MLIILWMLPGIVYAAEDKTDEPLTQQLEESGAADLFDQLPEETQSLLEELGITEVSQESVYRLNIQPVLESILKLARLSASELGKTVLSVLGILLMSALMDCIQPGTAELNRVFRCASVLMCSGLLLTPIAEQMERIRTTLEASTAFQLGFIPIFAGITAAGGQAVTAGKYTALTVTATQGSSLILTAVILPLLRMCMALSITVAAAPSIRLDGLFASLKKMLTTLLALLMTLFMAILSLQGAVGGAADSLADKAAQFVISNTIPVVGGALSQAYGSVKGYVGLLKTTVGAFGMIAAGLLILPQLISVTLWRWMLDLCACAGEILGQREVSGLMRNLSALLGILMSILLCSGLMLIVSVGVMLLIRKT